MKKILSYILTTLHLIVFGLTLVVFHGIQWLALNLGGYHAHKKSVKWLNFFLIQSLKILGNTCKFIHPHKIPADKPLIIVSNHQSLYDIPPIIYHLDKHHIKFVSKKELAKGIPSISFNLRHGGSVLIDRKDPSQALPAMKAFAEYLEKNNYAGVIYPEGTRSRDGVPKRFSPKGLKTLVEQMPSAYIVPITINNAWKINEHGMFPMNIGIKATWLVHKAFPVADLEFEDIFERVEKTIKGSVVV